MIKNNFRLILGIMIGFVISYLAITKLNQKTETVSSDIIIERIKSVKKIIVTEGYFSEVYSFKEASKYFYNLISFEKRALLLIKGKVQISYDLTKIEYETNAILKTIYIKNIPPAEINISPSIKYYDLQESTFNTFAVEDYNKLNSTAIDRLKIEIEKSDLKTIAKNNLTTALEDMQWVGKELGWKVVYKN